MSLLTLPSYSISIDADVYTIFRAFMRMVNDQAKMETIANKSFMTFNAPSEYQRVTQFLDKTGIPYRNLNENRSVYIDQNYVTLLILEDAMQRMDARIKNTDNLNRTKMVLTGKMPVHMCSFWDKRVWGLLSKHWILAWQDQGMKDVMLRQLKIFQDYCREYRYGRVWSSGEILQEDRYQISSLLLRI